MADGFEDLKIWKTGYALLMKVHDVAFRFPSHEKFGLTSQLERAANSIIANIAESSGRFYYLDKIKTLYHSRGELQETISHLKVALGFGYITELQYNELEVAYKELNVSLNNYINYLYAQNKEKENDKL